MNACTESMQTYYGHICILPQLTKHIFTLTERSLWETNKPYKLWPFMAIKINGWRGERCACAAGRSEGGRAPEWVAAPFCMRVCVSFVVLELYGLQSGCAFARMCKHAHVCPRGADHRRPAHQGSFAEHWPISRPHNSRLSGAKLGGFFGRRNPNGRLNSAKHLRALLPVWVIIRVSVLLKKVYYKF